MNEDVKSVYDSTVLGVIDIKNKHALSFYVEHFEKLRGISTKLILKYK